MLVGILGFIVVTWLGHYLNKNYCTISRVDQDWINKQCSVIVVNTIIEEFIFRDWWILRFGDTSTSYWSSTILFIIFHLIAFRADREDYRDDSVGLLLMVIVRCLVPLYLSYMNWGGNLMMSIIFHLFYNVVQFTIMVICIGIRMNESHGRTPTG